MDPTGDEFTFEKGATKLTGGEVWADVWKRHCFALEYKGKQSDLTAALYDCYRPGPDRQRGSPSFPKPVVPTQLAAEEGILLLRGESAVRRSIFCFARQRAGVASLQRRNARMKDRASA